MHQNFKRYGFPFILFFTCMAILLAGVWKAPFVSKTIPFPVSVKGESGDEIRLPAYTLILETPRWTRLGTVDHIRMRLAADTSAGISTSAAASQYSHALETRLDLTGGTFAPQGLITAPMLAEQTLAFVWNVQADSSTDLNGTVWIYLSLLPLEGGESEELALFAFPVTIPVHTVLGMSSDVAIILAGFGILISVLSATLIVRKNSVHLTKRRPIKKRK